MSEITTVVLDAMGGDNAPAAMIDGAIDAISKEKNVKVILVGIEDVIRKGLEGKTYNPEQIEIVNATEVIETAEPPVHAIRRKKDSSIVVGMKLVKEGKADAFVSAGSSGAILVGGQVIVGRIKGVDRAPLAPLIPTEKGVSLLLYKDARVDQKILDETFSVFGWKRSHQMIDGNLYCTVEVWDEEKKQWIGKQDVGTESYAEKEKGQASDSFKRACVNWGIGRELYSAPFIWLPAERVTIQQINGKYVIKDRFQVTGIDYSDKREIADPESERGNCLFVLLG